MERFKSAVINSRKLKIQFLSELEFKHPWHRRQKRELHWNFHAISCIFSEHSDSQKERKMYWQRAERRRKEKVPKWYFMIFNDQYNMKIPYLKANDDELRMSWEKSINSDWLQNRYWEKDGRWWYIGMRIVWVRVACSIVSAATADVCRAKIKNTFPTLECTKFEKVSPQSQKIHWWKFLNHIEKYVKHTKKTVMDFFFIPKAKVSDLSTRVVLLKQSLTRTVYFNLARFPIHLPNLSL